jgi:hypothetical protein
MPIDLELDVFQCSTVGTAFHIKDNLVLHFPEWGLPYAALGVVYRLCLGWHLLPPYFRTKEQGTVNVWACESQGRGLDSRFRMHHHCHYCKNRGQSIYGHMRPGKYVQTPDSEQITNTMCPDNVGTRDSQYQTQGRVWTPGSKCIAVTIVPNNIGTRDSQYYNIWASETQRIGLDSRVQMHHCHYCRNKGQSIYGHMRPRE